MPFAGFPRNVKATPVPDPIFNSLLEEIEDPAELKVTLRLIWMLGQKRGQLRFVAENELLHDPTLLRGLASRAHEPRDLIRQGLNLAFTRGTLLRHTPENQSGERLYLLNTEFNRKRLDSGQAFPASKSDSTQQLAPEEVSGSGPRPDSEENIYSLYENNIGTIGPMMAEQLGEAEERYPFPWIEEAFKLAVNENKRSWRYISAILRRWAAEGRTGFESTEAARNDPEVQSGVGIRAGATLWEADGRQHGEPGRHSEEDDRSRQPRSRQRR
jgi:DnaD/phage-associated family protein